MFERFTRAARAVVVEAQVQAQVLHTTRRYAPSTCCWRPCRWGTAPG